MNTDYQIPEKLRIGHVHLKVTDLHKSLEFYCGILGFEIQARYGEQVAFLSAGGYHHHIALNTWFSKNGPKPDKRAAGLFHVAILYPDRKSLAGIFQRLRNKRYPVSGASDHGISHAIYLDDPDGNGVELYYDLPRDEWPREASGSLDLMQTGPLDLKALLEEL